MNDPIAKFESWWQDALADSPLQQKSAVCVSTIDESGFPHGRFVDLKSVDENGFVFCTYLDSAKGRHIAQNSKASMTIWWDHVGYQVRVVGQAEAISAGDADEYWRHRSRSAQLTTIAFDQSEPLVSEAELETRLQEAEERFADHAVPRPDNWGGYRIRPDSIELLAFRENRLHVRERYERQGASWARQLLQP